MKFDVQLSGANGTAKRTIELDGTEGGWRISVDGHPLDADVTEVAPYTFSILLRGRVHEVRVAPAPNGTLKIQDGLQAFTAEVADPRAWRGRRHGGMEAKGRQQVAAPMPGKVVRVLVKTGDKVEAGQGLVVVEAMKMQNEIRSPKSGTVERVLASEGQAVNNGDVLVWVD
jgi:biotin carboxyl carrier protein